MPGTRRSLVGSALFCAVIVLLLGAGSASAPPTRSTNEPGRSSAGSEAQRDLEEARRLQQEGAKAAEGAGSQADFEEAIRKIEAAIALFRGVGDRLGEALATRDLCQARNWSGDGLAARDCYRRTVDLLLELGERRTAAQTLFMLHALSRRMADYQTMLDADRQALQLYRELGDRAGEAKAWFDLSRAYQDQGQYQEALDCLDQVISFHRSAGDRASEFYQLYYLGQLHEYMGDNQAALDCYRRLADFWRDEGKPAERSNTLVEVVRLAGALGRPAEALQIAEEILSFERSAGSAYGEARALLLLGGAQLGLGRREAAVANLDRSLETFPAGLYYRASFFFLEVAGNSYFRAGETEKALACFTRALATAREHQENQNVARFLAHAAAVELSGGRLESARGHLEEAVAISESIRMGLDSPGQRAAYFARLRELYENYVTLLMRLDGERPGQEFDALALEASEKARSRGLLELLNTARAEIRRSADPKLLEQERALRLLLNAKAAALDALQGRKGAATRIDETTRDIRRLNSELDQVESRIRAAHPRYAELTRAAPPGVKEIQQEALDAGTVLLEYVLGRERSFGWAVTRESMTSCGLPGREIVERAARRLHDLLSERSRRIPGENGQSRKERLARADAEFPEPAATLGRMLLGPVVPLLEDRRVLVVADGALQYIPFAVLPDPAVPGQPLVVGHEVVHEPSASVLVALRSQTDSRSPAPRAVAVLADPVFGRDDPRLAARAAGTPAPPYPDSTASRERDLERSLRSTGVTDDPAHLPRLPFSRREAQAIVSAAAERGTFEALDFRASRETATSPELSRYRIVHFATHGLVNSEMPALSGLVLSTVDDRGALRDGFLRLRDIFSLNLPADLVVLSACRTALGQEVQGEGLVGLTRGFMYAGAARVLASLWKVDDEGTAELMARFYHGVLREGLEPAAALRRAQVQMWKQKDWSSPFYWGAFVLQGEWRSGRQQRSGRQEF